MRDFDSFYWAHARDLVRFLLYRTGDASLAEDLAADTFERVIRARRPFDARLGSEKTWLYAIALNVLRDHLRHRAAEGRAIERGSPADGFARSSFESQIELRDEVSRALQALNGDEREAVALRYGADLTVPQMATATRTKPATIEKRLYRALVKLRDELAPTEAKDQPVAGAMPTLTDMPEPPVGDRFRPRRRESRAGAS